MEAHRMKGRNARHAEEPNSDLAPVRRYVIGITAKGQVDGYVLRANWVLQLGRRRLAGGGLFFLRVIDKTSVLP
jgi:hypothetical protein